MHRTYFRTTFTFVTYVEELWCPYGSYAQDYKAMGKRYSTGSVITLRTRDARVSPVVPSLPPTPSFSLFQCVCVLVRIRLYIYAYIRAVV